MVSAREIITRELETGPKKWSELRDAVKREKNITTATFQYHLSKLIEEGKVQKIISKDGAKTYEAKISEAAVDLSAAVELRPKLINANKEEIIFLLDIIERGLSEEAVKAALNDLSDICRREIVTNHEEIWNFFEKYLSNETFSKHWGSLIHNLIFILRNAKELEDKETIKRLKSDFLPRIIEMAKTYPQAQTRNPSMEFINILTNGDEKFNILKDILEKVVTKESGDFPDLYPLMEMYKTRKMDIRRWLYGFLETGDEKTRMRAYDLLNSLR